MAIDTNLTVAKVTVDGKEMNLKATDPKALHKPSTAPSENVIITINTLNEQVNLGVGSGLEIADGKLKVVVDLTNYYTKNETYTKNEVDAKVSAIPKFGVELVNALPTENISKTTIYLLKKTDTGTDDYCDEYLYTSENKWELIGSTKVNLEAYAKTTEVQAKVEEYVGAKDEVSFTAYRDSATNTWKCFLDSELEGYVFRNNREFLANVLIPAEQIEENDKVVLYDKTIANEGTANPININCVYVKDINQTATIKQLEQASYTTASGLILRFDCYYRAINDTKVVYSDTIASLDKYSKVEDITVIRLTGEQLHTAIENNALRDGIVVLCTSNYTNTVTFLKGHSYKITVETVEGETMTHHEDITAVIDISGKQDTLVSGENIKMVNNQSILGEGNLDIGIEIKEVLE